MLNLKPIKVIWPLISFLLLAVSLLTADFGTLAKSVASANIGFLVLSAAFGLFSYLIWSWEWQIFGEVVGIDISFLRSFQLFSSSNLVNLMNPLGGFGGQLAAAYSIHSRNESSFSSSLAAFVSVDLLALTAAPFSLLLGYSLLAITGTVPNILQNSLLFSVGSIITVAFIGYLLWRKSDILANNSLPDDLVESFALIGDKPGKIMKVAILANISHFSKCLALLFAASSVGINLNPINSLLVISIALISEYIPFSGSGARVASISGIITILVSVNYASALSAALLYQISTRWLGISIGFLSMNSLSIGKTNSSKS